MAQLRETLFQKELVRNGERQKYLFWNSCSVKVEVMENLVKDRCVITKRIGQKVISAAADQSIAENEDGDGNSGIFACIADDVLISCAARGYHLFLKRA